MKTYGAKLLGAIGSAENGSTIRISSNLVQLYQILGKSWLMELIFNMVTPCDTHMRARLNHVQELIASIRREAEISRIGPRRAGCKTRMAVRTCIFIKNGMQREREIYREIDT